MKRSEFLYSAASLGASALLAGCSSAPAADSSSVSDLPVLRIGADHYPPYTYKDSDGRQTGIDVDLAIEALRRMKYQPEFVLIDWELKNELLEDGTIDCLWDCFSMTDRENDYRWAGPYMVSRQVLAVNADSRYTKLHDLDGKVVAVQSTTLPETLLQDDPDPAYPQDCEIYALEDADLLCTALSKGYVDAVAAHETSIQQYMRDYGTIFRILAEPLVVTGLGVAFRKDDDRGIAEEMDRILDEMRADGTTEAILRQYFEAPESYLEVERIG